MADEEVATKAPESDATEAQSVSGIAGDTKPDQGAASMGEHCTSDRPTPGGETPTGEITKFHDIEVYITKPADYPHSPCKLLLLLTGGTGIHSTNNQLQADKYATEGFLVVMPDQFAGDPAPSATTTATQGQADEQPSLIEQVKLGVAGIAKSFTIDMWLARHTPEKVLPLLNNVITSVKEEFADAVANGGGIYAVGYCFGAKYALMLGSDLHKDVAAGQRDPATEAEEGMAKQGPQIKCGAIAHATGVSKEDMANCQVPTCVVAVEDDPLFPDHVRNAGLEALKTKGLDHQFKVYTDVPHGFAVMGSYEDQSIMTKQTEAYDQMLTWLKAH
ncbi:dienelactone hydrolase family protein [Hortaea werneckii]|nr:dienelactone hydrolase family protein [Hortaea werneckii]KAI7714716.1 dienelactone hydrolase family protein [Hortaea werneckii]